MSNKPLTHKTVAMQPKKLLWYTTAGIRRVSEIAVLPEHWRAIADTLIKEVCALFESNPQGIRNAADAATVVALTLAGDFPSVAIQTTRIVAERSKHPTLKSITTVVPSILFLAAPDTFLNLMMINIALSYTFKGCAEYLFPRQPDHQKAMVATLFAATTMGKIASDSEQLATVAENASKLVGAITSALSRVGSVPGEIASLLMFPGADGAPVVIGHNQTIPIDFQGSPLPPSIAANPTFLDPWEAALRADGTATPSIYPDSGVAQINKVNITVHTGPGTTALEFRIPNLVSPPSPAVTVLLLINNGTHVTIQSGTIMLRPNGASDSPFHRFAIPQLGPNVTFYTGKNGVIQLDIPNYQASFGVYTPQITHIGLAGPGNVTGSMNVAIAEPPTLPPTSPTNPASPSTTTHALATQKPDPSPQPAWVLPVEIFLPIATAAGITSLVVRAIRRHAAVEPMQPLPDATTESTTL